MDVKDKVEEHLLWKVNSGPSSLWWDNSTGLGAMALVISYDITLRDQLVQDVIKNGVWNIEHLHLPEYLAEHILNIPIGNPSSPDSPIWMSSTDGHFSTSCAWKLTRQKQGIVPSLQNLWHKYLPFKMSFLVWRLFKNKLPFDEVLVKFGQNFISD